MLNNKKEKLVQKKKETKDLMIHFCSERNFSFEALKLPLAGVRMALQHNKKKWPQLSQISSFALTTDEEKLITRMRKKPEAAALKMSRLGSLNRFF